MKIMPVKQPQLMMRIKKQYGLLKRIIYVNLHNFFFLYLFSFFNLNTDDKVINLLYCCLFSLILFSIVKNTLSIKNQLISVEINGDDVLIVYQIWNRTVEEKIKINELSVELKPLFTYHKKCKSILYSKNKLKITQYSYLGWSVDSLFVLKTTIDEMKKNTRNFETIL